MRYSIVRCDRCGDHIVSFSHYDCKQCSCSYEDGKSLVDGGLDYCRVGGGPQTALFSWQDWEWKYVFRDA